MDPLPAQVIGPALTNVLGPDATLVEFAAMVTIANPLYPSVCVHACMHVCIYACMYVCTCSVIPLSVCMYVCMYVYTCACSVIPPLSVCMHVCMYVCVRTCMCTCMCVCTCMYVYVCLLGIHPARNRGLNTQASYPGAPKQTPHSDTGYVTLQVGLLSCWLIGWLEG